MYILDLSKSYINKTLIIFQYALGNNDGHFHYNIVMIIIDKTTIYVNVCCLFYQH